jgi:GT2 family glycosyltransferase/glycosyltransferase involved in cell wall biosynthesis
VIDFDAPRTWSRLREVEPGTSLGLSRGDCAVCIPVYGGYALFTECIRSILRHTRESVPVVIADDASPDGGPAQLLRELDAGGHLSRDIVYTRQASNLGFVGNMNSVMEMTAPADIVILNSDCVVSDGWYECLRDAAYSDSIVATATTLTNNGTILSVPYRNQPSPQLPQDWTLDQAAAAVRNASPRLRPRIPTAIGHCTYIRRTAIELVGMFDTTFSPGYGEEVDFSQRCIARGLSHVAADDVLVWHHGRGSFGMRPEILRLQEEHDRIIDSRYPYYAREVEALCTDQVGPLARSIGAARRALLGISVTVDASCLTNAKAVQGTQLHALELIRALHEERGIRLRVAVPRRCSSEFSDFLRGLSGLETIYLDEVRADTERSDIVHRPYQVPFMHELVTLQRLGDRLVVTQQDLIAYRNPSYFRNFAEWTHYRRSIRASLALAEVVVFVSQHAAGEAVLEGLVERHRTRVVGNGIDHHFGGGATPRPPREAERMEGHPLLVCIGADFQHKNRVFALRVLDQLQRRHGWTGRLVLVGPKAWCGSSSSEEAAYLLRHPEVDAATVLLPAVTEDEKLWLMRHAVAVLYPTTYEGFGLVPFEAAAFDLPCIFAPQASLAEVLPEHTALILPWDEAVTADRTIEVLQDPGRRSRLIADVLAAGERYRWQESAAALVAAYRDALEGPPRWSLGPDLADPGMTLLGRHLVGTDGALPEDVQHVLWAIGRRRAVSRPFFGALTGVHSAGRAVIRARERLRARRTRGD